MSINNYFRIWDLLENRFWVSIGWSDLVGIWKLEVILDLSIFWGILWVEMDRCGFGGCENRIVFVCFLFDFC